MHQALIIIAVSFVSALLAEGISWVLIYRTDKYQKMKRSIDKISKQVEKEKESLSGIEKKKQKDRRVSGLENQLKALNRDMAASKMKSTFFVMMILFGVFYMLGNMFNGQVVAKLPFSPLPLIRGMTHRNLPGEDFTDCAMTFIYILCSLSVRANITRFFGFAPRNQPSMFTPPADLTTQ